MPYIKQVFRSELADSINQLVANLKIAEPNALAGEINYAFTTILNKIYDSPRYKDFNEIMGILECVKLEHYRRRVAEYEDMKAAEHGDVF